MKTSSYTNENYPRQSSWTPSGLPSEVQCDAVLAVAVSGRDGEMRTGRHTWQGLPTINNPNATKNASYNTVLYIQACICFSQHDMFLLHLTLVAGNVQFHKSLIQINGILVNTVWDDYIKQGHGFHHGRVEKEVPTQFDSGLLHVLALIPTNKEMPENNIQNVKEFPTY